MQPTLTRYALEPCAHEKELAAAREQIRNLETALVTARRIGAAVGVIMATYKVTDDDAFDLLVVASQNTGRKLRDVAEEVVETGTLHWASLRQDPGLAASAM